MRHVHIRKVGPNAAAWLLNSPAILPPGTILPPIFHRIPIDGIYGHQSIPVSESRPDCPLEGMLGLPTQIRSNKIFLHPLITFLYLLNYPLIFLTQNRPTNTLSLRCRIDRREDRLCWARCRWWASASVSGDIAVEF